MNKVFIALLALPAALFLSGCVSTIPMHYAPSSVLSASGNVSVEPFSYGPAINGKVKPNQIRNTALGNIYFEQDIDTIFRDSVFKELRFVGVKVDSPNTKLTGVIEEFLIDDLGYSVDWTITVIYTVTKDDQTVYESRKELKRTTSKFANVFGALNETIKLNIEELIKDPKFIEVIN